MKYIKKVSEREMKKKFPGLFAALDNPRDALYCNTCDGLRIFKKGKCTVCGKR